jgi:hypothetical protein
MSLILLTRQKETFFFYFQVVWPAVDFTYQWLLGDLLVDPACA